MLEDQKNDEPIVLPLIHCSTDTLNIWRQSVSPCGLTERNVL